MLPSSSCYQISVATEDSEVEEVVDFVNREYFATYATTPPKAHSYAIVKREGILVACMGIEYQDTDGYFLIERVHGIDKKKLPVPMTSDNGVQFVRLVSKESPATPFAIYAAAAHVIETLKREFAIVEHTLSVHRVLTRMGIKFWNVERHGLNLDAIAMHNRTFYNQDLMRPYIVECSQIVRALSTKVKST